MNDYPTLRFNDSGTEVTILFGEAEDRESLVYTSKEAVFETVNVLLQTNQITLEKATLMRQQIIDEENLVSNFEVKMLTPFLGIYVIKRPYFFYFPDDCILKPLKPFLDTCTNTERMHYHITCTAGYTAGFYSKSGGNILVQHLLKDQHITEEDAKMLYEKIEETSLPPEA